ncbi:MAG: hypothetical protein WC455_17270 [Dehalococcoidia bacterium]|jgi:hypothetical protein
MVTATDDISMVVECPGWPDCGQTGCYHCGKHEIIANCKAEGREKCYRHDAKKCRKVK